MWTPLKGKPILYTCTRRLSCDSYWGLTHPSSYTILVDPFFSALVRTLEVGPQFNFWSFSPSQVFRSFSDVPWLLSDVHALRASQGDFFLLVCHGSINFLRSKFILLCALWFLIRPETVETWLGWMTYNRKFVWLSSQTHAVMPLLSYQISVVRHTSYFYIHFSLITCPIDGHWFYFTFVQICHVSLWILWI
jgi:hypothetical protein